MAERTVMTWWVCIAGLVSVAWGQDAVIASAADPLPGVRGPHRLEQVGPFTWRDLGGAFQREPGYISTAAMDVMRAEMDARDSSHLQHPDGTLTYAQAYKWDRRGHLWIVVDVDWDLVARKMDDYDIASDQSILAYDPEGDQVSEELDDTTGVYFSYTDGTCGATPWSVEGSESRNRINGPGLTDRQKTAVTVLDLTNSTIASGVTLDNQWVLTCAHCVTNGAGEPAVSVEVEVGNGMYTYSDSSTVDENLYV